MRRPQQGLSAFTTHRRFEYRRSDYATPQAGANPLDVGCVELEAGSLIDPLDHQQRSLTHDGLRRETMRATGFEDEARPS